MTDILAIIPARGGSKGIPLKNLVELDGKPLLAHTIEAAQASTRISRIIVSTDDRQVQETALKYGGEAPFLRPAALAGDEVHAVNVAIHAVKWLIENENYQPEIVVMLLPTSPLRRGEQIDAAIRLYEQTQAPAVISVYRFDKQLPHLRRVVDGVLEPVIPLPDANVQRQDLEPLFVLNGSIYVAAPETVTATGTFHVPGAAAYEMDFESSVDINGPEDLELARYFLSKRRG
jgi:N-acylneuraminate cytidylyltransferase/CMP-N,N'-diacetyllegionaminic acid synthase